MSSASDQLADYLPESEPIVGVYSAEHTDQAGVFGQPVVVGITDRRLVSLSDAEEFTSIPYDHISSIRSARTSTIDYRGSDYRLLLAGSVLLALTGLVGAVVLLSSLALTSLLLTVGGVLVLYFGAQGRPADLAARLGALDYWDVPAVDDRYRLLGSGGALTVLGLTATVVLTPSSWTAVLAICAGGLLCGGIWLGDYAWSNRAEFDGIEIRRRTRKRVWIGTDAGTGVNLSVGSLDDFDRTLSREMYATSPGTRSTTARLDAARDQ